MPHDVHTHAVPIHVDPIGSWQSQSPLGGQTQRRRQHRGDHEERDDHPHRYRGTGRREEGKTGGQLRDVRDRHRGRRRQDYAGHRAAGMCQGIRRRLPRAYALVVSTHEEHRVVHAGPHQHGHHQSGGHRGHRNQPALGEPGDDPAGDEQTHSHHQ
ncbi:Uncharacterised protein [Mycobacteroides abscessus subsp. massiliense]|nr:Uncharacterised protein [Mycobacteroides abscessus subsp. massiliense]